MQGGRMPPKQLWVSRGPAQKKVPFFSPRSSHIVGKEGQEIGRLLLLACPPIILTPLCVCSASRESRLWPRFFLPGRTRRRTGVVVESGNSGRGEREIPSCSCRRVVSRITCVKATQACMVAPTCQVIYWSLTTSLIGRFKWTLSDCLGSSIPMFAFEVIENASGTSPSGPMHSVWVVCEDANLIPICVSATQARCIFTGAPVLAPRRHFGSLRPR
jgi:hypothetical protein